MGGMASDGERFSSLHVRNTTADGSAFDDYEQDNDNDEVHDRPILETGVVSSNKTSEFARAMPLTEPYDRYKSIELRAECYRRGTRPIRVGPKANDNKAGYMMLLRAYDLTQGPGDTKSVTPALDQSLHQLQYQNDQRAQQQMATATTSKKRKLPSPQESNNVSDGSPATTVTTPAIGEPPDANTAKRRSLGATSSAQNGRECVAPSTASSARAATSAANGTSLAMAAVTYASCDPQVATEYVRLKMQLLLESREIEKTSRREDQRLKLHAELRGVIATLAQLRNLAKEYALEHNTLLLADVTQDIAYFMEQKRKLKLEVELLDRLPIELQTVKSIEVGQF